MWESGEASGGNNSTVKRESTQGGVIFRQSQGSCKKKSKYEHYFEIRRCRMGFREKVARGGECFDYTLVEDEPDARTARDSGIDLA